MSDVIQSVGSEPPDNRFLSLSTDPLLLSSCRVVTKLYCMCEQLAHSHCMIVQWPGVELRW